MKTTEDARDVLCAGVSLFNDRKFWEAHEAWEALWLRETGDARIFIQGLIQVAAAYHHVQRGTLRGGLRLFESSVSKLLSVPEAIRTIAIDEIVATVRTHREWVAVQLQAVKPETSPPGGFPTLPLPVCGGAPRSPL